MMKCRWHFYIAEAVQLERREFRPYGTDTEIYYVGGDDDTDFPRLLDAARKAVALGYRVYILPNPHGIRTADFIFERKGVYRMYDLKTVYGKNFGTMFHCLPLVLLALCPFASAILFFTRLFSRSHNSWGFIVMLDT